MTRTKPHVVFIGAGKMGLVLGDLMKNNTASIHYSDIDPKKMVGEPPLAESLPEASVVFLCVPSFALSAAVSNALPYLRRGVTLVSITKGIEAESRRTVVELMEKATAKKDCACALLCGPMLADELEKGLTGFGIVAARDKSTAGTVARLFTDSALKVEPSTDITGVAFLSVLKNIYALGIGIADGLKLGHNVRGFFIVQALTEMKSIIKHFGGQTATADSWAGLGDLVATGFSDASRNRSVGINLANDDRSRQSEGTRSLSALISRLGRSANKFPLLWTIKQIVQDNKPSSILADLVK